MTVTSPAVTLAAVDPVRVTAIIVTWRSRDDIEGVLASLGAAFEAPGIDGSIVVVDNASTDDTVAWLRAHRPDVQLIESATNEGFGRACNRAFEVADGAVWLLVNPDARLLPDTIVELVDAMRREPRAGAIAPTLAAAGEAESAGMLPSVRSGLGHFLFLNRVLPDDRGGSWRGVQLRRQRPRRLVAVEWASAAVLALRPASVRAVDGFDETMFLYGEDIDLCARLGAAGWSTLLAMDAAASHAIGASSDARSSRWLDGLDDAMVRLGRSRLSRTGFFASASLGLLIRAGAVAVATRTRSRPRTARLLPGARRAAVLAARALVS